MKRNLALLLYVAVVLAGMFATGYVVGQRSSNYTLIVRDNHGNQWTSPADDGNHTVQFFNPEGSGRARLCLPNQVVSSISVIKDKREVRVISQSIGYTLEAEKHGIPRWPWPNQSNDDPTDEERAKSR